MIQNKEEDRKLASQSQVLYSDTVSCDPFKNTVFFFFFSLSLLFGKEFAGSGF